MPTTRSAKSAELGACMKPMKRCLLFLLVLGMTSCDADRNVHDASGRCVLQAAANKFDREAQAKLWGETGDTDAVTLLNLGRVEWHNLEVTVNGFETNGIVGRRLTGPYKAKWIRDLDDTV